MERIRKVKVKGGVKKQRFFRLLQKAHVRILNDLDYYRNEEENN